MMYNLLLELKVDEHWDEGEAEEVGHCHLWSTVTVICFAGANPLTTSKSTAVETSVGILALIIATSTQDPFLTTLLCKQNHFKNNIISRVETTT